MDCPSAVRFGNVLSFLTASTHHHTLLYLAVLETRHYASSTRMAVASALKCLTRHLPETRQAILVATLTQTTSHDITSSSTTILLRHCHALASQCLRISRAAPASKCTAFGSELQRR